MELSRISLGMALRTAREAVKVTANDLARQVGMTPSAISRTENGLRALELSEAARIAPVLGTTVEGLLTVAKRLEESGLASEQSEAVKDFNRSLAEAQEAALAALKEVHLEMTKR
jgi:transcriptional regulator with XRE-family HTH domain